MKKLIENFRRFAEDSQTKMKTLYHFTDSDKPEIVLDPLYAQQNPGSHSRNEWNSSMVPRVFFYVDLRDQESFFNSSKLYSTQVPADEIYDLASDKKGFLKKNEYERVDFDQLLRDISGWSYQDGEWKKSEGPVDYLAYELYNGMKVVVSFIPVVVKKHNMIHGGEADFKSEDDFDPDQLRKGIEVEYEHTDDYSLAKEIAMDHLAEDPEYYDKLPDSL